jgi:hypothetical protein
MIFATGDGAGAARRGTCKGKGMKRRCPVLRLLRRFVREEGGFVSGPEWAFVATILVLGAITGAMMTRHAAERESSAPPVVRSNMIGR